MKSFTTSRFRDLYAALPEDVRAAARESYQHWRLDAGHPGLRFKPVHPSRPIWSVRIGRGWRALRLRKDDGITWFWIGSHADYDRLLG